ncbi:hypothetical protein BU24DRAFT_422393 [Aaosphaeria arxii CBS 175.79]|uniref:Uncharacterized protein n=1 Tax=Aaosphaeria arxii CBS 175.79 TaxID=1450172 RepID=A0A6A5XT14_9PLEO|nr:uncharacterized protein BU24DRAFT_422393 [Aaosphaeria arxii CBS 175.79]KAF2016066.1 hypothetical protein BU24DRAFT_422393 [Aaosphaeria arxii CBS 175.79]
MANRTIAFHFRTIGFVPRAPIQTIARSRRYATEHPPSTSPPPPPRSEPREPQSRAGAFYKSFASPIVKCFLGALFTYQVTYWGWMKLETLEEKRGYDDEIRDLKDQLKVEVVKQIEATKGKIETHVPGEMKEQVGESSKKKGWLW